MDTEGKEEAFSYHSLCVSGDNHLILLCWDNCNSGVHISEVLLYMDVEI